MAMSVAEKQIRKWLEFVGRGRASLLFLDSVYSQPFLDSALQNASSDFQDLLEPCHFGDIKSCLIDVHLTSKVSSVQSQGNDVGACDSSKTDISQKTAFLTCGCEVEFEAAAKAAVRTYCRSGEKLMTSARLFNGQLLAHGFFVGFDCEGRLHRLGKYRYGKVVGTVWSRLFPRTSPDINSRESEQTKPAHPLESSGWLITRVLESTGDDERSVYLYPDLETALVGRTDVHSGLFKDEVVLAQVVGITADNGVITPILRSCEVEMNVPRGPSLSQKVLQRPNLSDPYEARIVEVRESLIPGAGEGLFTKRPVQAGQLVAYFAGVELVDGEEEHTPSEYSIALIEKGKRLDIPEAIRGVYCATLGHKACHSFQPNATYSWIIHPWLGFIRCLVSLHDLEPGIEVTTDYKYSLSKAPEWYKDCLLNYLVLNRGLSRLDAEMHIRSMSPSCRSDDASSPSCNSLGTPSPSCRSEKESLQSCQPSELWDSSCKPCSKPSHNSI